jgi:type I restriction enzyme R subunit
MPTELFCRRKLPHWDLPGATYFVTSCLEGSIPASGLTDLCQYRDQLAGRRRPEDVTEEEWEVRQQKLLFARFDEWLDGRPPVRHLEQPALAGQVQTSLMFFAGIRCEVFAFVVMPSHFHWVFQPTAVYAQSLVGATARERLMQGVKTFTARGCNILLGRRGQFWQEESYDHWVRDPDELERIIQYVENNPVKAGLCQRPEDWPWSSARWRMETGTPFGHPLRPRVK